MYGLDTAKVNVYPFLKCIKNGFLKKKCKIIDYFKKFNINNKLFLSSSTESLLCEMMYLNFYKAYGNVSGPKVSENMFENSKKGLDIYKSFKNTEKIEVLDCWMFGINF